MKKLTLSLFCFLLTFSLFAGGIVTNSNQSAAWTRTMVRDASTGIDAVYYNPAGLTKLSDGLHISLNSQTIGQLRTISTANDLFNTPVTEYEGETLAPVFPGVYLVYKTGNWAISFGFNGVGGGGTAEFATGLPSMELPLANMTQLFANQGLPVTGYNMDMNFTGSSIYFGFQLGASYAINDHISVFGGGRYVMAKNTYEGELGNVQVLANGAWSTPGDLLRGVSAQAAAGATTLAGYAASMDPLITMGLGDMSFENAITYATSLGPAGAELLGNLQLLQGGLEGQTGNSYDDMKIIDGQSLFNTLANNASGQAAMLNGMATGVDVQTADQKADVVQKGNGFTPIVGLNISAVEDKLNIGMKYEFKTNLILTNETTLDFNTAWDASGNVTESMFPDKAETNIDMPALLSVGIKYEIMDGLSLQAGFHTYFDSEVEWANVVDIDGNSIEYAFGAEYNVTDALLISAGWLATRTSARDSYHTDLSYSLNTNSFGGGGAYKINDMLTVELGAFYTLYEDFTSTKYNETIPSFYNETYKKSAWGIGVGLNFTLFGDTAVSTDE